jgi:hypothetical protein
LSPARVYKAPKKEEAAATTREERQGPTEKAGSARRNRAGRDAGPADDTRGTTTEAAGARAGAMGGDGVALLVNFSFMLAIAVAFLVARSKIKRARGRNLRELASPLLPE